MAPLRVPNVKTYQLYFSRFCFVSFQIRKIKIRQMEDEGNHGNDETRLFILSSLAQHHKSRVTCVLCEDSMLVFDRYPLVDGTFFLSPKQHSPDCTEVSFFFYHTVFPFVFSISSHHSLVHPFLADGYLFSMVIASKLKQSNKTVSKMFN